MALKYYIYGEVVFNTAAKRDAAGRRLDTRAGKAGFTAEAWPQLVDQFGSWPSGRANIVSPEGLPGMRISYVTLDPNIADQTIADITAAWDVFQDSSSWWGYAVQPDAEPVG